MKTQLPEDTQNIFLSPILHLGFGKYQLAQPDMHGGFTVIIDYLAYDNKLKKIELSNPITNKPIDVGFVQRFLNNDILVCETRSVANDHNGFVFSENLEFKTSFPLGDAIEKVIIDRDDKIWVGYFDEGVLGDDPLSHSGLNRFSSNGLLEFRSMIGISDCYNINLDYENNVYICPYHDAIITKISQDEEITISNITIGGAPKGLFVKDGKIAKIGVGYERNDPFGKLEKLNYSALELVTEKIIEGPMFGKLDENLYDVFASCVTIIDIESSSISLVRLFDENKMPISCRICHTYQDRALITHNSKIYELKFDMLNL